MDCGRCPTGMGDSNCCCWVDSWSVNSTGIAADEVVVRFVSEETHTMPANTAIAIARIVIGIR